MVRPDGTNAGDRVLQNTKSVFSGVDNNEDVTIECNIESILDDIIVNTGGQYYTVGENINFTKERGGTGAIAQIEQTYGVIDSVQVESGGSGTVDEVLSVTMQVVQVLQVKLRCQWWFHTRR